MIKGVLEKDRQAEINELSPTGTLLKEPIKTPKKIISCLWLNKHAELMDVKRSFQT